MATSIPPHNLGEVIDGVIRLIDNPDIGIKDLTKVIKGPDFPTGATIMGKNAIREAYATGRGRVTVRAKATIEASSGNRHRIIVTEIPYQVNKSRVIERIAQLVRDKKIEGISDIRDETDRKGMRIVIELKRDVNPQVVLNLLYKHTQLQDTFSIIMIALVDGQPRVLNLKEILEYYLAHQKDVVRKRTIYDLNKAEKGPIYWRAFNCLGQYRQGYCNNKGFQNRPDSQGRPYERVWPFGKTGPGHTGYEASKAHWAGTG